MKTKKTIQFIEFTQAFLLIGIMAGIVPIVTKSSDDSSVRFILLESFIAIPFLCAFFFRKYIIIYFLKKTPYPGALYSVLDKMGFTRNLDINLSDPLLDDIYKPGYQPDSFLTDNDLKTDIGKKRVSVVMIGILSVASLVAITFFIRLTTENNNPLLYMIPAGVFFAFIWLFPKVRSRQNDADPLISFTNGYLQIPGQQIKWADLYDWEYEPGGRQSPGTINLTYYDANKESRQAVLYLSQFDTDKIDMLMLLWFYKARFGQTT